MATIKVVLRSGSKENKDGTRPLALRIIKDRKPSFIHLGYSLLEKDWDATAQLVKKSHPNSVRLNNFIASKIAEARDKALEVETQKKSATASAIKQKLKPLAGASFFAQADLYLANLKASGNYNIYTADKPRVKHFREFLNNQDIAFSDITQGLLNRFQVYLKSVHHLAKPDPKSKRKQKPLSERTIMNHLVVVRSVFSQAIKEGVTEEKYYPFGKGKISITFPETTKAGISAEDVKKLETVNLTNPSYDHARNLWLISFYFAGMRVSDILRLRWSDFQDWRLHYTMGKNHKAGSLKTPEKAMQILEKYAEFRENADDLIFPELKKVHDMDDEFDMKRKIAFATSRYDKFLRQQIAPLAKIEGKLTMHIARHTFATLAGDKIPVQMLQKLYRHSDIKTTIGYQANFINQDADDALDRVLGS